ncbi:uncharacterized protein TEOVI_000526500 [Trypanosoma equiperdum]|uniref:RRM domain-containing protein n=2 Tax=Trypanozoon TaxID=39700 RepID=Q38AR0_TRYB2|nr:hypothetical protein, conserved [Trypanosoma brucei brucei TREU927]EAN78110.1 hypothetical protein, conserved [Trypanosoma brucei brucei TREU927]SCU68810.1 hypothetical protein, conserved [Trypanosoma equiperdum]
MDPSKRICLKNIPPECTKREIAEFIRNRTGGQPHSIDLGLDSNGRVRRYAHFSVEGAKNVVSALTGATWKGVTVSALHANPHYTYRLAESRRRREHLESEEKQQREELLRRKTERWLAKTGGELPKGRPPKPFFASRQRYAEVASEIAKKSREEHRAKRLQGRMQQTVGGPSRRWARESLIDKATSGPVQPGVSFSNYLRSSSHCEHEGGSTDPNSRVLKRQKTERAGNPAMKPVQQQETPQTVGPTREERKLSGLKAKLEALRAKMK